MYFMVSTVYILDHLIGIHQNVFGEQPLLISKHRWLFNTVLLSGPAFSHVRTTTPAESESLATGRNVPTDDWPYLYLSHPQISGFYLSLIAIFATFAIVSVFVVSREMRAGLIGKRQVDFQMLLFGASFLLLETELVTAMNLVWGATWLTSAVVFGSILFTLLVATVISQLSAPRLSYAVAGLVISLLVVRFVPTSALLVPSTALRLFMSMLYAGTPIFFASMCFAILFRRRARPDVAFGWNLLGAVLGGLAEFLSMLVGLKAMVLFALASYLCAFLLSGRENGTTTDSPESS